MTYTNEQLKRTLAKMLPERVCNGSPQGDSGLFWRPVFKYSASNYKEVLDTELLHLCQLIYERMNEVQLHVLDIHHSNIWAQDSRSLNYYVYLLLMTWQQRTIALAKVLNIEIV